jgi:transposase
VLSIIKFYFFSSPESLFPNPEGANTRPTRPAHQARPRDPGLGCTACWEHCCTSQYHIPIVVSSTEEVVLCITMFREVVLLVAQGGMFEIILPTSDGDLQHHLRDGMCSDAAFYPLSVPQMAPNLAASQHELIRDMIVDGSLSDDEMAKIAKCSSRTIRSSRVNLHRFGSTTAPYNGRGGRPRSITPPMLDALRERLIEKPDQYLDEMAVFLWDEFEAQVATSNISRALKSIRWSKKVARRVAAERSADLRDLYLYDLSSFEPYHVVYVDESGCDKEWDIGEQDGLLWV